MKTRTSVPTYSDPEVISNKKRFILEFVRDYPAGTWNFLSTTEYNSIWRFEPWVSRGQCRNIQIRFQTISLPSKRSNSKLNTRQIRENQITILSTPTKSTSRKIAHLYLDLIRLRKNVNISGSSTGANVYISSNNHYCDRPIIYWERFIRSKSSRTFRSPSSPPHLSTASPIFFSILFSPRYGGWHSTHVWSSFGWRDCGGSVGFLLSSISDRIHVPLSRFSGIVTAQTFAYFKTYPNDAKGIKILVGKLLFDCFLSPDVPFFQVSVVW